MKPIQDNIREFLLENKTASISVIADGRPYSVICFYFFDPQHKVFIFKSSEGCYHKDYLSKVTEVSGTVLPDRSELFKMKGIQFAGKSLSPAEVDGLELGKLYNSKFTFARMLPGYFWAIRPDYIKFTDNTAGFGKKTLWNALALEEV